VDRLETAATAVRMPCPTCGNPYNGASRRASESTASPGEPSSSIEGQVSTPQPAQVVPSLSDHCKDCCDENPGATSSTAVQLEVLVPSSQTAYISSKTSPARYDDDHGAVLSRANEAAKEIPGKRMKQDSAWLNIDVSSDAEEDPMYANLALESAFYHAEDCHPALLDSALCSPAARSFGHD